MDLKVTSVAVTLMLMFAYGDAIQCYVSGPSGQTTDCAYSCTTVTTTVSGSTTVTVGCSQTNMTTGCDDSSVGVQTCYCNKDLCNTKVTSTTAQSTTTRSSGPRLDSLYVTLFVTSLTAILKRYLI